MLSQTWIFLQITQEKKSILTLDDFTMVASFLVTLEFISVLTEPNHENNCELPEVQHPGMRPGG